MACIAVLYPQSQTHAGMLRHTTVLLASKPAHMQMHVSLERSVGVRGMRERFAAYPIRLGAAKAAVMDKMIARCNRHASVTPSRLGSKAEQSHRSMFSVSWHMFAAVSTLLSCVACRRSPWVMCTGARGSRFVTNKALIGSAIIRVRVLNALVQTKYRNTFSEYRLNFLQM